LRQARLQFEIGSSSDKAQKKPRSAEKLLVRFPFEFLLVALLGLSLVYSVYVSHRKKHELGGNSFSQVSSCATRE